MPDNTAGIQINYCVVAPTKDDLRLLPERLRERMKKAKGTYDIDKVYGQSRDDWCPFNDTKSVEQYVSDCGLIGNPYTGDLDACIEGSSSVAQMTRDVDLFVIDPLFLALGRRHLQVVSELQTSITSGMRQFVVVVPDRLPSDLVETYDKMCHKRLGDLEKGWPRGEGEYRADRQERLLHCLSVARSWLSAGGTRAPSVYILPVWSSRNIEHINLRMAQLRLGGPPRDGRERGVGE
jgi:hypothetical protein